MWLRVNFCQPTNKIFYSLNHTMFSYRDQTELTVSKTIPLASLYCKLEEVSLCNKLERTIIKVEAYLILFLYL